MEHSRRRAEYAATTRNAIVTAARNQFAKFGYVGASVDAIAEEARVTKGAVYHHFENKSALFESVFVVLEDELMQSIIEAVAAEDEPVRRITVGLNLFLSRCSDPIFRRIALEDGPSALGWQRWRELEDSRFHALIVAALELLNSHPHPDADMMELSASIVLAALGEAGLAVARSNEPDRDIPRARALLVGMIASIKLK